MRQDVEEIVLLELKMSTEKITMTGCGVTIVKPGIAKYT